MKLLIRQVDAFAEFYVDTPVGRFGAGRGFMASWVAHEIDLSGTQLASLLRHSGQW